MGWRDSGGCRALWSAAALAGLVLGACGRLQDKEAVRRFARAAVAAEKEAARVCHAVSRLEPLVSRRDLGAMRRHLRTVLGPALQAWVERARALPADPATLRAARRDYVRSVERLLEAQEALSDMWREDLLDARWQQFQRLWRRVRRQRQRFRRTVDGRLRARDMRVRWPAMDRGKTPATHARSCQEVARSGAMG